MTSPVASVSVRALPHKVDTLPLAGSERLTRFIFDEPKPHNFRHLFAVLNSTTMEPFKAENWLNHSKIGPLSILLCRNVSLVRKCFVFLDDELLTLEEEMPGYISGIIAPLEWGEKLQAWRRRPATVTIEHAFVITHIQTKIFGHFLMEALPKCAMIAEYYKRGHEFPIVIDFEDPPFVEEFIRLAIPNAKIQKIKPDECFEIENCLLPSWPKMYLMHEFYSTFLKGMVNRVSSSNVATAPQHILISRANVAKSYRQLQNWSEIEAAGVKAGLTVVRPEDFAPAQQIALFANAACVVGEYGSALHNALFGRANQKVLSFNWINQVQQAIGLCKGQENIFLMPNGGAPVLAPDGSKPESYPQLFEIDVELAAAAMGRLLEKI